MRSTIFFEEIVSTLQIPFFLSIKGWFLPTGHQNQKRKGEAYVQNGNLATYDSNVMGLQQKSNLFKMQV